MLFSLGIKDPQESLLNELSTSFCEGFGGPTHCIHLPHMQLKVNSTAILVLLAGISGTFAVLNLNNGTFVSYPSLVTIRNIEAYLSILGRS